MQSRRCPTGPWSHPARAWIRDGARARHLGDQDVASNYDGPLPPSCAARARSRARRKRDARQRGALPVIADHSRRRLLIADGVLGQRGRNYVLRMILRRAARFGKLLGIERRSRRDGGRRRRRDGPSLYGSSSGRSSSANVTQEERFLAAPSPWSGAHGGNTPASRGGQKIVPGDEVFACTTPTAFR